MKHLVTKQSEEEITREFPIAGLLDGWFFRKTETSAGVYEVVGSDLWGRRVSETGIEPEIVLANCVAQAREIEKQLHDAAR